jgi:hypothetical protein
LLPLAATGALEAAARELNHRLSMPAQALAPSQLVH